MAKGTNGVEERLIEYKELLKEGDVFFQKGERPNTYSVIFCIQHIGPKKIYATGDYYSLEGRRPNVRLSLKKLAEPEWGPDRPRFDGWIPFL